MIWLIKKLIFGHVHKWEILETIRISGKTGTGKIGQVGIAYSCKCSICGRPKLFRE